MELKDAIAQLAEGMRAAYELRAAGVSDKEAAEKLGLSVGSYQKRVSRANAAVAKAVAVSKAPVTFVKEPGKSALPPGVATVLGVAALTTGLSVPELVEAAIETDPAKQQETLHKIAENAKPNNWVTDMVIALHTDNPAPETGTVVTATGGATVNPSDPGSIAAAKESAKADKPKGKPGRKPLDGTAFDLAKAIELYKAGTKVTDIAVAMGYPKNHGQNRVRTALMAAGVYGKIAPAPAAPAPEKKEGD